MEETSNSQQHPLLTDEKIETQSKTTVKDILNRMPVYFGFPDDRKPIRAPQFID